MSNVLTFRPRPGAPRAVLDQPRHRAAIERAIQHQLDAAEELISVLDAIDGDPDLDADHVKRHSDEAGRAFYVGHASDCEDEGNDEPSLGAPEGHESQRAWARGADHDGER